MFLPNMGGGGMDIGGTRWLARSDKVIRRKNQGREVFGSDAGGAAPFIV